MKTLLVSLDSIGDCIINLIFYKNFKELSCDETYMWISDYAEELTKIIDYPIKYFTAKPYWHNHLTFGKGNILDFVKKMIDIKKENFDRSIILHSNTHKTLSCLICGIKKRYGWKGKFINQPLTFDPNLHILENYKNIIEEITHRKINYNLSYDFKINENLLLKKLPPQLKNLEFITFHPFSGSKKRFFSKSKIKEIVKLIGQKSRVVIILTKNEENYIKELRKDKIFFSSDYPSDLTTVASIIYHSKMFIGQDSGMIHLAALLRKPFIGFFSRDKKRIIAPPLNQNSYIIEYENSPDEINLQDIINII